MTKAEARKIHAHFEASNRISYLLPVCIAALVFALGFSAADTIAMLGASMAFVATVTAVSTDMMSRRIPNGLSLLALLSAPVWWFAASLGSDLPVQSGDGVVWSIFATIYGVDGSGSILPAFGKITYPMRIGLDMAMLVVVFVPLYLSFALGLGFGGGDVKLMAGLSMFLGWPLGLDFFFLTFLVGGIFSVGVILGRKFSQQAIRLGWDSARLREWAAMREFPFAPPIGIAAIICFAIKLQGLN